MLRIMGHYWVFWNSWLVSWGWSMGRFCYISLCTIVSLLSDKMSVMRGKILGL